MADHRNLSPSTLVGPRPTTEAVGPDGHRDDVDHGGTGGHGGGGGACFSPTTDVVMADGTRRRINTLRVGDVVLARDERTGLTEGREVLEVLRHDVVTMLLLRLENGDVIETTGEHRFATVDDGWVCAGYLCDGDRLVAHGAAPVGVAETELKVGDFEVFNLTVAHFHTYFVGPSAVWVHNAKDEP